MATKGLLISLILEILQKPVPNDAKNAQYEECDNTAGNHENKNGIFCSQETHLLLCTHERSGGMVWSDSNLEIATSAVYTAIGELASVLLDG